MSSRYLVLRALKTCPHLGRLVQHREQQRATQSACLPASASQAAGEAAGTLLLLLLLATLLLRCSRELLATASVLRTPVRDAGSQRLLRAGPNEIFRAGAGRRQAAPMQCHASSPIVKQQHTRADTQVSVRCLSGGHRLLLLLAACSILAALQQAGVSLFGAASVLRLLAGWLSACEALRGANSTAPVLPVSRRLSLRLRFRSRLSVRGDLCVSRVSASGRAAVCRRR